MEPIGKQRVWRALAAATARGVLGLIFLMAGINKVFVLTPSGHVAKYFLPFQDTFLPTWSLWVVGFTIPFVELVAGGLTLVGWGRTAAYFGLGVVLVIVTFGHLLHNSLYPFHEHVIPRLALLLFLLVMPPEADRFSVDELVARRRARTLG
jgi:uncharacterized membrane protein YphA (DoxX/SURF4 family)